MKKVAVIGCGRMGTVHARNLASHPRLELAAIADADPVRRKAQSAALGTREALPEEILADASIAGVVIATPTRQHLDGTLQALRAGKAVFCEKPLSLDLEPLRAAAGELATPRQPVFVAFNRRFDPHYRALKSRIDSGVIGALETIHIVNHDPAMPALEFIPDSGGLFKDFTIHDFDMAAWLLGEEPAEVFAWSACLVDPQIAKLGDADTAKLLLRTASGKLCAISNSRRTAYGYDQRIEAFGSKGCARVDNLTDTAVDVWDASGRHADKFPHTFIERYAGAYRGELDHFADVLEGKARPETGYAANVRALALAEAAEQSVRSGAPVRLSP
jgi:myo-inositol 2-dehydrogenase/D-chiro-inositol 1-dehydrogenase